MESRTDFGAWCKCITWNTDKVPRQHSVNIFKCVISQRNFHDQTRLVTVFTDLMQKLLPVFQTEDEKASDLKRQKGLNSLHGYDAVKSDVLHSLTVKKRFAVYLYESWSISRCLCHHKCLCVEMTAVETTRVLHLCFTAVSKFSVHFPHWSI